MKGGKTPQRLQARFRFRIASMRPAREGRENQERDDDARMGRAGASMRPAREGRENSILAGCSLYPTRSRFNEARP